MNITKVLKTEAKNNFFHYLLLSTLAVFFLTLLTSFRGQEGAQFVIFLSFTIVYILWGVFHHYVQKSLTAKIVIEYILFGAIALLLVGSLLVN